MTHTARVRRRFKGRLSRLKETLTSPTVVTYHLVDRESVIELEDEKTRGLLRLYYEGVEMSVKEFAAKGLEDALKTRPPIVSVRLARHPMSGRDRIVWYLDRVIDLKIDLSVVWADLPAGIDPSRIQKPAWVDADITENPEFTPMGFALQACDHKGIPRP